MKNKLTIAIPIRRRTDTLAMCMLVLARNSRYEHDIVLSMDRPWQKVRKWVERNKKWLAEHNVKVTYCKNSEVINHHATHDQEGTATASNWVWQQAETEWLMCMDDDMLISPNWDYNILRKINDKMKVYVPTNVVPERQVNRTADWGEWYHLTYPGPFYPIRRGKRERVYIKESEFVDWYNKMKRDDVYIEPCGHRILAHWMPIVIHKTLFELSGGYDPGVGRDINFDSKLGQMGIRTSIVSTSKIPDKIHFRF